CFVAQVGRHGHDLADRSERLQEQRAFGVADRDADDVPFRGEALDQIAADEARPTEYGNALLVHSHLQPGRPNRRPFPAADISDWGIRGNSRDSRGVRGQQAVDTSCARHYSDAPVTSPGGGIGRRAGFRYLWPQGRGSSSLLLGTMIGTS